MTIQSGASHIENGRGERGGRKLASVFSALWMLAAAAALSGCVVLSAEPFPTEASTDTLGHPQLVLEPVDVWSDAGSGALIAVDIDDEQLYFRHRPVHLFEKAWIRAGLFWHPKLRRIMVPIVVVGPPVTVSGARLRTADGVVDLSPAKNFDFTPGARQFDRQLSATAYEIDRDQLRELAYGGDVYIELDVEGGVLEANIAATPATDNAGRRDSARYHFVQFAKKIEVN